MADPTEFLDPKALSKFSALDLVARLVVEGFVSGLHKSPYHGFSVEFAEHRQYVPGDELRRLDWKVFARSDRFYIKQYEEETNLRAYLLLDASGSMRYSSDSVSKLRYGQCLSAALAYLMLQQQDSVGLVTFDREVRSYLPPRSAPTHLKAIMQRLTETGAEQETKLSNIFHELAERIRRRGLIIVISDLFDDPKDLMAGLSHFRHKKHEVIVFHVLDPYEKTFPFRNWTMFRNLERGGHQILTEPQRVRRAYLEAFSSFCREVRRGCFQRRIDYVELDTSTPYDVSLSRYLAKRAGVLARGRSS
jgi:uncharacterized protein (DUF58 family)